MICVLVKLQRRIWMLLCQATQHGVVDERHDTTLLELAVDLKGSLSSLPKPVGTCKLRTTWHAHPFARSWAEVVIRGIVIGKPSIIPNVISDRTLGGAKMFTWALIDSCIQVGNISAWTPRNRHWTGTRCVWRLSSPSCWDETDDTVYIIDRNFCFRKRFVAKCCVESWNAEKQWKKKTWKREHGTLHRLADKNMGTRCLLGQDVSWDKPSPHR